MAAHVPSQHPHATDALSANNADAFWKHMWGSKSTGWKEFEKDHSIFSKNIRAVEEALQKYHKSKKNEAEKSDVKIFSENRGVFIPLCGDTFANRFFVGELLAASPVPAAGAAAAGGVGGGVGGGGIGALKQISSACSAEKNAFMRLGAHSNDANHHFVVGVDLAPESIVANMRDNFPDLQFAAIDHSHEKHKHHGGVAPKFIHYFARVVSPADYDALVHDRTQVARYVDIHLFDGDYFEVVAWWRKQVFAGDNHADTGDKDTHGIPYKSFDFVYDRASLIAMHPSLHQLYVDALVSVLEDADHHKKPRIFLELVHRPEGFRNEGPPFHIPPLNVASSAPLDDKVVDEPAARHFFPLPWRRLELDFQEEMPQGGPPFRFRKHVVFMD